MTQENYHIIHNFENSGNVEFRVLDQFFINIIKIRFDLIWITLNIMFHQVPM